MEYEEFASVLKGERGGWKDADIQRAYRSRTDKRCTLCPHFLNDPRTGCIYVRDNGTKQPQMLVVGEAPGIEESQAGTSFVGKAARHGIELLKQAGVPMEEVTFTNAVRCFPHEENMSPRPPSSREVLACLPYLFDTIDLYRPKVIFTFGKVPTELILGRAVTITKIAGDIFRAEIRGQTYYVVPSIHPSADLRSGGSHANSIKNAAAKAWSLVNGSIPPVRTEVLNGTAEASAYLKDLLRRYWDGEIKYVAYDIEYDTTMTDDRNEADRLGTLDLFNPDKHLVAVSFATSADVGTCIPLDNIESRVDWQGIMPLLRQVLETIPVVVHGYLKAEGPWSREKVGVTPKLYYDTMLMSYALFMRTCSHGLKSLARTHLGWADWSVDGDAWFNSQPPDRKSYKYLPMEYLGKYSAIDPAATYGLMKYFESLVTDEDRDENGVWTSYQRRHDLCLTMLDIEFRGNIVDRQKLEEYRVSYPEIVKGALDEMRTFEVVRKYEDKIGAEYNPRASQQVVDIVYGSFGAPPTAFNPEIFKSEKDATVEYMAGNIKAGDTELKLPFPKGKYWLGKLSGEVGAERIEIAPDEEGKLKLKTPIENNHPAPAYITRGTPKADDDNMVRILRDSYCKTCGGKGAIKKDEVETPCQPCKGTGKIPERAELFRFVTAHRLFKKAEKARNDYFESVAEKLLPDSERERRSIEPGLGILTCNYIVHATQTGRMSTKNMNVHSWPYHSDVRRLLVSKWKSRGGLILAVDESQIEMRVLAALTNDEAFVKAYLTCSSCNTLGTTRDKGLCTKCGAKLGIDLHKMIAAVIYRKDEKDVLKSERAYAKAVAFGVVYGRGADSIADDTGMSIEEARDVINAFYNRFPEVKSWVDAQHRRFDEMSEDDRYDLSALRTRLYYKNDGISQELDAHFGFRDGDDWQEGSCATCAEDRQRMNNHRFGVRGENNRYRTRP